MSMPDRTASFPVRGGADRVLVPDERSVVYAAAHTLRPTALVEVAWGRAEVDEVLETLSHAQRSHHVPGSDRDPDPDVT